MRLKLSFNLGLVIILVVIMLLMNGRTNAQEPALYVCRDTSYEGGIRYEFRNLPDAWVTVDGFWYVAEGTLLDGHTLIADALTDYPADASGIKPGEAVIGNTDYSIMLKGTSDTAPCDLPPESTPAAPQCPAWAFDSNTGEIICLWSLPKASN